MTRKDVDLTDELERLTAVGNALRQRLGTYEHAAMLASEQSADDQAEQRLARDAHLARLACEAAEYRSVLAAAVTSQLEQLKVSIEAFYKADEEAHAAFVRAASPNVVDGRCRSQVFEAITRALAETAHVQPDPEACKWKAGRVRAFMAEKLRDPSQFDV
ncbi:hypothetical protein NF681_06985 [Comamonadaceae bacterium OTU4NAUVB1]|nr:hypothetical protein NF681_06985 [Comamonadaceae bacterium OTU4NAUVB1]